MAVKRPNPWVEDAQILVDPNALKKSSLSVLRQTREVEQFLDNSALNSSAIVAPKGFGKTFLLKLKRVSLQSNHHCLPKSPIVDRPTSPPPILSQEVINLLTDSTKWESLWQIAFSIQVLKSSSDIQVIQNSLEDARAEMEKVKPLVNILSNRNITSSFQVIHNLISLGISDIYSVIRSAIPLIDAFGRVHHAVAIFIDNIDEYLESYTSYDYELANDRHHSYLKLWHNGQIGAWRALRRLNGINPHIKIFMSLRKEAFFYAKAKDGSFANLKAFSNELSYDAEDITEIILKNIRAEPKSNLRDSTVKDPFISFVGPEAEYVSNSGTGKPETAKEYWLRHCTTRPRDSVAVGLEISNLGSDRRNRQSVRAAINRASAARVTTLFSEVQPFFEAFYPEILTSVISTNVLNFDQLQRAAQNYAEKAKDSFGATSEAVAHPFCALYAIGLLGIVKKDRGSERLIQEFAAVGTVPFGATCVLPNAETYLLHPALSDWISERDVSFLPGINKHNVVGDGLEWRVEDESRVVIKGDIGGYRQGVMNKSNRAPGFDAFWRRVVKEYTRDLDFADVYGGDGVILADRSPLRALRAAVSIKNEMEASTFGFSLRFGAHRGQWRVRHDDEGVAYPEISDILGVAARLEPLANLGDILISQNVLDALDGIPSHDLRGKVSAVDGDYNDKVVFRDGFVNLAKPTELEEWIKLFSVGSGSD